MLQVADNYVMVRAVWGNVSYHTGSSSNASCPWHTAPLFMCCTPGVPLTPSNVLRAVREVKAWWRSGGLGYWLSIPESVQEQIRQSLPDETDQKKQAISYWINTDPLASWRRLIRALDVMREAKLADAIRSNAEPLTGILYACTCIYMYIHHTVR